MENPKRKVDWLVIMRDDLVSIIMAAYNAEDYIEEAIYSVLGQSHSNFELIIVNDGSTDETEEKVLGFSDARIRYIRTTNNGVSAARNYALAQMKGNYFCFLDSDDMYTVSSISSRLEKLQQNACLAFVDGYVMFMDELMKNTLRIHKPTFQGDPLGELVQLTGKCFSGPTWLIVNDKSYDYRFKEGLTHGEDLLFYITIASQGAYDFVREPILKYRTGNSSAMSDTEGSQRGYEAIYAELMKMHMSKHEQMLASYRAKARSVMFKTYLHELRPIQALKALYMFK